MAAPRTYAIGDIHGSLDKLRSLIARCEHDSRGASMRLVFLGDYIDRGPDSRGVIEFLIALQARMPGHVIALMGNHEAMALDAIDDKMKLAGWLIDGGAATLRSYGIKSPRNLPHTHVAWLRTLRTMYDDGQRLFVHAGVDPERPLDAQDDHVLWIREPFLSDGRDYGRLIVHGHTPTKSGQPDLRTNRLNIDTGAVFGRALTAAVFTDEAVRPIAFLRAE